MEADRPPWPATSKTLPSVFFSRLNPATKFPHNSPHLIMLIIFMLIIFWSQSSFSHIQFQNEWYLVSRGFNFNRWPTIVSPPCNTIPRGNHAEANGSDAGRCIGTTGRLGILQIPPDFGSHCPGQEFRSSAECRYHPGCET